MEKLVLDTLEYCLSKGGTITHDELCASLKCPSIKVKNMLLVLENRGYLIRNGKKNGYILSKKFMQFLNIYD